MARSLHNRLGTAQRAFVGIALFCAGLGFVIAAVTPALPPFSRVVRCAIDGLVFAMLFAYLRQTTSAQLLREPRRRIWVLLGRSIAVVLAVATADVVVANTSDPWLRAYRICLTVGFVALFGSGLTIKGLLRRTPRLGRAALVLTFINSVVMVALYLVADVPGMSRWADDVVLPSAVAHGNADIRNMDLVSGGRFFELVPNGAAAKLRLSRNDRVDCEWLPLLSETGSIRSLEGAYVVTYGAADLAGCAARLGTPGQAKRALALFVATARAHPTYLAVPDASHARACGVSMFDGTMIDMASISNGDAAFREQLWRDVRRRVVGLPQDRTDGRALGRWEIACQRRWLAMHPEIARLRLGGPPRRKDRGATESEQRRGNTPATPPVNRWPQ